MTNYCTLFVLFFVLMIGITFSGCKKNEDNTQNDTADIPATTKVISDSNWESLIQNVDTTAFTFRFKANPDLSEGDILVSSFDGGYLRRVTSVEQEGEQTVIQTEFASITDAIRNAEIDYSQPLVVDQDALKTAFLEQGVTINEEMLKNSDNTNLSFNIDFVLYDEDGNQNTTGDQIKMQGHFGTNTEFSAYANIQNFVLEELSFTYDIHKEKSLNVSCALAAINLEKEQRIARIPFHDIVIPAGIPITFQPVLELYAGVRFELNSQLQMGMIETVDYTTTVSYENGQWSTSKTVDESFDYAPPSLTAGLQATAYIKPKLLFKIYRFLSPKVEANLYGQLSAETRAIDWELSEGFSVGVGVEMKIWDQTLFDFTANVIDLKYAIAQGIIGSGNAPVVDFSGMPLSGDAPLTVQFTDLSINNPTSWSWDFGDGNSSTQQNPSHLYSQPGTYTVILSGTNNYGTDSKVKNNYIQVNGTGSSPLANFSASPVSGQAPLTVSFTDLSTNEPTSWNWDFGDGNSSSDNNPNHTYNTDGSYTVSLTVANNLGSDTKTMNDLIYVGSGGGNGDPCPGMPTVTDIDGNVYNTVQIGTQCWMKENLKTTTYRNGTAISNVTNNSSWSALTSGAYVWYDNDISWKDSYGALYNWYAVKDANGLCPMGWHVSTYWDWGNLVDFIGGWSHGNELKSCRQLNSPLGNGCSTSQHPRWDEDTDNGNYGTDNYGFSSLPGGFRGNNATFFSFGTLGNWWTNHNNLLTYNILHNNGGVYPGDGYETFGFSVRCIRD